MDEAVRLREPDRKQIDICKPLDYDKLIECRASGARHLAGIEQGLDLSRFCAPIRARENSPGRAATDPRLLLALWLYGLSEGVNSAREMERLSTEHAAYRWLCGGVSINYHTAERLPQRTCAQRWRSCSPQVLGRAAASASDHACTGWRRTGPGCGRARGRRRFGARRRLKACHACGARASGAAQRGGRRGSD